MRVAFAFLAIVIFASVEFADAGSKSPAVGAKITSIAPGSVFERLGLKEGDVILSVDGRAMTDAKELENFFKGFGGQKNSTIKVEIERSGVRQVMTYKINK